MIKLNWEMSSKRQLLREKKKKTTKHLHDRNGTIIINIIITYFIQFYLFFFFFLVKLSDSCWVWRFKAVIENTKCSHLFDNQKLEIDLKKKKKDNKND